ncbi:hypothetical protein AZE42_12145 [Rhizopogon vesiculosus]|uniref:Uncharacterized protein n=1 Tax=Rhizopogon vesiculosus TaxID=180088 RepID=A0A1J8PY66_9AGAM|nr:hypothetical protein AZE42_12145 [Rhizopogon vesiculosus]
MASEKHSTIVIEDDHAREGSKSKRPRHVTKPHLPFTYIATQ